MTSNPDSSASGSTEIDTNEVREALRERAREAISKQPARTVTILSSLLAAQDELSYLPVEAIDEVAQHMSASANAVWGIASFYPNFRFTPPNRHKVELCWGPTCHVLGAQHILQELLPRLKLDNEGETEDGVISLKLNTCLGVCAHGPAMSFDEELTGHMSLEKAVHLVERIRAEDEEMQRAELMVKESERSKVELAAKATIRTAEHAAKAKAAAEPEAAVAETEPDEAASASVDKTPADNDPVAEDGTIPDEPDAEPELATELVSKDSPVVKEETKND